MKNILLLSSVMIESEFVTYQSEASYKPNPSNQNFYARLLKAFCLHHNVSVVSHRPFNKKMFNENYLVSRTSTDGKNHFYYTYISSSKGYKLFREQKCIGEAIRQAVIDFHSHEFVIVVDVLRYGLLKAALEAKIKYGVKVVGMLTDNPANISDVKRSYVRRIISNASKLDGYLSLTDGLVKVFNKKNKPSYVFEGLVDEQIAGKEDPIDNYYFFAGSLYERYGVKNLIDAFKESPLVDKLLIAGNGPLHRNLFELEKKDSRILYLSQLPKEKIYSYEKRAIANINPRPLNSKLDNESVPSKLIEYLASGRPTISTKHPKLYEMFRNEVFWIEDSSKDGIKKALEDFSNTNYTKLRKMASTALVKVYELYGVNVQGLAIAHFIDSLNSKANS